MEQTRLYLSVIPEALVGSMLTPVKFGRYLAVGSHKRSSGMAIYFEINPDFSSDFFDMSILKKRCVAHEDDSPKRSVYLGIYRVLEHIPLEALGKLYLTTRDGQVLALKQGDLPTGSFTFRWSHIKTAILWVTTKPCFTTPSRTRTPWTEITISGGGPPCFRMEQCIP